MLAELPSCEDLTRLKSVLPRNLHAAEIPTNRRYPEMASDG